VKKEVYQYKYDNTCEIDMYMRRKCQQCRLKKCLTVGMRSEGKVSTTVSVVVKSARGKETTKQISADVEDLINRLIYYQAEFELPSEDDMKKISVNKSHLKFI
jgi:ecdysone receptor